MKVKVNYHGKMHNGEIVEQREDKFKVKILNHMGQFLAFDWFENRELRRMWRVVIFFMLFAFQAQAQEHVFVIRQACYDKWLPKAQEYEDTEYYDYDGVVRVTDERVFVKGWGDNTENYASKGTFFLLSSEKVKSSPEEVRIDCDAIDEAGTKFKVILTFYPQDDVYVLTLACDEYRIALSGPYQKSLGN